jgi:hypothetical protein
MLNSTRIKSEMMFGLTYKTSEATAISE